MGTWGTAIFSDDLASDIRNDYIALLQKDTTNEDATDQLMRKYQQSIGDADEGPVFWLALAAIQWKYGRLLPLVKDHALQVIDGETDLRRWAESPQELGKRRKVLEALRDQLLSPQPPLKKVRKPVTVKAQIGDVFMMSLPNGQYAYAQFVYHDTGKHDSMGTMVRVFDLITDEEVLVDALQNAGELFPPVFVSLLAIQRMKQWKKIGHLPLVNFRVPLFRAGNSSKPGVYHHWWIWDKGRTIFIGDLPEKYRKLEMLVIWGTDNLEQRIVTGKTIYHEIL